MKSSPNRFFFGIVRTTCITKQLLPELYHSIENNNNFFTASIAPPFSQVLFCVNYPINSTFSNMLWVGNAFMVSLSLLLYEVSCFIVLWFLFPVLLKHLCEAWESYSKSITDLKDSSLYCHCVNYENVICVTFGNLKIPNNNLIYFIFTPKSICHKNFEEIIIHTNIINKIVKINVSIARGFKSVLL